MSPAESPTSPPPSLPSSPPPTMLPPSLPPPSFPSPLSPPPCPPFLENTDYFGHDVQEIAAASVFAARECSAECAAIGAPYFTLYGGRCYCKDATAPDGATMQANTTSGDACAIPLPTRYR
eukprot:4186716-Prymnesium_polylepis.1